MKTENRVRDVQIKFRMTQEEAELLDKIVVANKTTKQRYLLHSALNAKIVNTDGIKLLLPELKRIGNNINQIAKAVNSGLKVDPDFVKEQQKELSSLWEQLKLYLATHE